MPHAPDVQQSLLNSVCQVQLLDGVPRHILFNLNLNRILSIVKKQYALILGIKQLEEIMLKLNYYENMSEEEIKQDIINSYYVDSSLVNKFEILIAYVSEPDYEESSFFLLRDKETGELFENHAGHCSCYGFEGQFEPKATTLTYLKSEHFYAYGIDKEQLKEFFSQL